MEHYLIRITYASHAWSAWLQEPHSCESKVKNLAEKLGGKLLQYWWSHGEFDKLIILQMPNRATMESFSEYLNSMGGFSDYRVTSLLLDEEAMKAIHAGLKP